MIRSGEDTPPPVDLLDVNGKAFCMVYMTVVDEAARQVEVQPIHGTARLLADRLVVEVEEGDLLAVPDSALPSIRKSDGREPLLKDAVYFVIVKVGTVG